MATNNTKTKSKTSTKAVEEKNTKVNTPAEQEPKMKLKAKDVDIHQYVTVRNGFQGTLVYKSPKTGEIFKWEDFGDEQDMELVELRNAKSSSSKKFFENNWFMFDEDWIVDYLGVKQFYNHAVRIEDFDDIFRQSPEEIKKTIESLSPGQKRSASYRARQLVLNGEIDSYKAVNAIEKALGVELVER